MPVQLHLPKSTASVILNFPNASRHPGLQLDKFCPVPEEQKNQKDSLELVCKTAGDPELLKELLARRSQNLTAVSAVTFKAKTTGFFTLHLSRASALENAGLCLHALYGFAYIPGSGLKGMARAFAETVWFPQQFQRNKDGQPINDAELQKATAVWRLIEVVFGWAPGSDKGKDSWKPTEIPDHDKDDRSNSGSIIFHDAWPESWPKLFVDIVNNHHVNYYGGEDAPGDWEDPTMVSFLAIQPCTTFSFALSKRRRDDGNVGQVSQPANLLSLAQQWLIGALTHLGAGAKTAAGYGCFQWVESEETKPAAEAVRKIWTGALDPKVAVRAEFTTTLELVTPAFLAGADQKDPSGCDLRPATLRGLLRWWWRTLHAGFVDVPTLRALESAIWGNTQSGGAVRITVQPDPNNATLLSPFPAKKLAKNRKEQDILIFNDDFGKQHGIQPGPAKTTQPLLYNSYGMDEMKTGQLQTRNTRFCIWPGAKWQVTLCARKSCLEEKDKRGKVIRSVPLSPDFICRQAQAALWLLCQYGGVGSKARKGFGSFADFGGMNPEECAKLAQDFRKTCQLQILPAPQEPPSPSLGPSSLSLEIQTPWKNCWFALDHLAASAQDFAQAPRATGHGKHCKSKLALGLPRKIHGPLPFALPHQQDWSAPEELIGPKGERHASPVHYHLAKDPASANLSIRVTAFPSSQLPDFQTSKAFLQKLLAHLKADLERRVKDLATQGQSTPKPSAPSQRTQARHPSQPTASRLPNANDRVEAILLEEKTKKGGWTARHEASNLSGPIQNTADVPPDKKPGDKVQLLVASCNPTSIAFRWPTPADEERLKSRKSQGGQAGGPSRGPGGPGAFRPGGPGRGRR